MPISKTSGAGGANAPRQTEADQSITSSKMRQLEQFVNRGEGPVSIQEGRSIAQFQNDAPKFREQAKKLLDAEKAKGWSANPERVKAFEALSSVKGPAGGKPPAPRDSTTHGTNVPGTPELRRPAEGTTPAGPTPAGPTPAAPTPAATATPAGGGVHTVKEGDSLWRIAQNTLGDGARWKEIADLNAEVIGADPNKIYPGQKLRIPPLA